MGLELRNSILFVLSNSSDVVFESKQEQYHTLVHVRRRGAPSPTDLSSQFHFVETHEKSKNKKKK